jgi:hypothetical protein
VQLLGFHVLVDCFTEGLHFYAIQPAPDLLCSGQLSLPQPIESQ